MVSVSTRARYIDKAMTFLFYGIAFFFVGLLSAFVGYILYAGLKPEHWHLIFAEEGIGNQLFNTIYLVFLALLISVPVGMVTGIYMACYAKKGRLTESLRISIETLSSLPSIVVGLFGYLVFILLFDVHWNLFSGAMAVSILTIPVIATTTEDALRALPPGYAKASYGLGATQWYTLTHVLLPAAMPQIITGIILATGRALGEAAALLYTAGMSTDIHWASTNLLSPTNPWNPFRPGETLALQIWASRTEAMAENAADLANLAAAVLVILVFSFSITARLVALRFRGVQK